MNKQNTVQLKLEVIRFNSADVIATSARVTADVNEVIANFTLTNYYTNNYIVPNAPVSGSYTELTSGQ